MKAIEENRGKWIQLSKSHDNLMMKPPEVPKIVSY